MDHDRVSLAFERPRLRTRLLGAALALAAAALLVALIVLVQNSNRQRDAALARTRHSYDVVIITSAMEGALARAEAALGRFVIDGDRRTGTIYYDEWRHGGYLMDQLTKLVNDDPGQRARMRLLRMLYARRGLELALPATRANYQQGWPALALFARAGRSDALPRISEVLRQIVKAEGALLDQRSSLAADRANESNHLARLLSVMGVLLALSVAALGWLAVRALADRRIASETAESEANRAAALERAVLDRTAELSRANERLMAEAKTREEAEARLRQVQKMEAVGQLTGGIAHDFNNMLAVVLGGLEMARKRLGERPEEARHHLDSAMEGTARAAALTRRLLSFARAEPLLPKGVEPAALLRGMSDLIDRTIGERIEVRIEAAHNLWSVWVDAYQLENAILNLAVNARDAMDGAGLLTMSAANIRLGGEVGALPAGDYVRLSVQDNGSGMSPETMERVFEPFFTTKPVGQGTGLGLSQILGFARQSGGDVGIVSTFGQGTTVSIYLPRHVEDTSGAEQDAADAVIGAPRAIGGTILVVEDDVRVRAALCDALAEFGYACLPCETGQDALKRLEERRDITLLITDVVMPGMTGPELAEAVRARHPQVRLLFVTGYVGERGEAENFKGAVVLRKPFTLRSLQAALASIEQPRPVDADLAVEC